MRGAGGVGGAGVEHGRATPGHVGRGLAIAALLSCAALLPGAVDAATGEGPGELQDRERSSAGIVTGPDGATADTTESRPRVREAGIAVGRLAPGPLNAVTDVPGVLVGHATLREGRSINTGVTAVLPHGGNLFREPVRGAIAVGNGFGKLIGVTQVNELGEIETPILLTGTLNVWRAADALVDTMLAIPENREVRSINPVVGETNDGFLSDIRRRPVGGEEVRAALRSASAGPVEEGSVGAGTGTTALGWKGGIGTSSRRIASSRTGDSVTVGVLVQTNYGGDLRVAGVPVGRALGEDGYRTRDEAGGDRDESGDGRGEGSVMVVVATDAPLAHRELQRLARRAFLGVARTGSTMSHGSGDYAIAFSTDRTSRRGRDPGLLSTLFAGVVEATEEAVLNSLFRATTVRGHRGTARALPLERTLRILGEHGR